MLAVHTRAYANFATLPDLLASRTSDCGEHCVDRWASRMPTVER
eukprot:COSAG03_NODE_28187_length_218_cov_26.302521_1_plen_43_part_01